MNTREQKGREMAARLKIVQKENTWIVPSQTGNGKYEVDIDKPFCTCPDFELRGLKCKHIYAVEYSIKSETDPQTQTTRITYKQDWPMYNEAQTNEKALFQSLLYDLVLDLEDPVQTNGRPRLPLRDMVFSAVFKVYSTVSTRRFMCDLKDACAKGYLEKVPHFNSILNYLESESLTPTKTC